MTWQGWLIIAAGWLLVGGTAFLVFRSRRNADDEDSQ
jgi:LPXTG-motif cell wall-anchored protein